MTDNFRSIIANAIRIRMNSGEDFATIIASYPKLNADDVEYFKARFDIKD